MEVSACYIVKNEEQNIANSIDSINKLVKEIIVVDTGSTDKTVEIASSLGAEIYYFKWVNDFSKARNYAISKAKGDWIIFLDADEFLTEETVKALPEIIKKAQKSKAEAIVSLMLETDKSMKKINSTHFTLRFFKNHKQIKYKGAIHEKVTHNYRGLIYYNAYNELKIIHTGYTAENRNIKSDRNLNLLLKELEINPRSSDLCFYISESYFGKVEFKKCIEYGEKAIEYNNASLLGVYEKNYINIIESMNALKMPKEKNKQKILEALQRFPSFPDFYFYLGDANKNLNYFHDAIEDYEQGLKMLENGISAQTRAYSSLSNVYDTLGHLYYRINQVHDAVKYFIEALKLDKYYSPSLEKILLLFVKTEKTNDIVAFISKIFSLSEQKDILFLFFVTLKINNGALAQFFYDKLAFEKKENYKDKLGKLYLLNEKYEEAISELKIVYEQNKQEDGAFMKCIVAATLSGNIDLIQEVISFADNEHKKIAISLTQNKTMEEIDEVKALNFFMVLFELGKAKEINKYKEFIEKQKLSLEIADLAYIFEQYDISLEYFNKYNENEKQSAPEKLAEILFKKADCNYRLGHKKLAIELLNEAQLKDSKDMRSYELSMTIYLETKDDQSLKSVIKLAKTNIPESNYIRKLAAEIA